MDEVVLRDDESRAGLRRLHVIASLPVLINEVERAVLLKRWEERWVLTKVNGGVVECRDVYEDSQVVGLWHLRLYWKVEG